MDNVPTMPEEYKGAYLTKTEYIKNTPRKWTKLEVKWCEDLSNKGYSYDNIAKSIGRQPISVSIKMKRLSKKNGSYNAKHIQEKYKTNDEFIEFLKPKSILDVFCGKQSVYKNKANKVITNDIDKNIDANFNTDALKLLCHMYYVGEKFDFIDLDPYGSASECFDLAIKLATKGIAITFGEMGHKRFKRLDYVKRHYNITTFEDFTTDRLIEEAQKIALKNKKELEIFKKCEWNGISRVWFIIKSKKITEQWDK